MKLKLEQSLNLGVHPTMVSFDGEEVLLFKLVSEKNHIGFKQVRNSGRYEAHALSPLKGTKYEKMAQYFLKDIHYYITKLGKIYVFGDTYGIKDDLKAMGFRWGGYNPVAHWDCLISNIDFDRINSVPIELKNILIPLKKESPKLQLKINEAWINLKQISRSLKNEISDSMKFKVLGAEFSNAFQNGEWDGYKRLYDFQNNRFPIGFLKRVLKILDRKQIEYEIVDNRKVSHDLDLVWNGFKLRDYQKEYITEALVNKIGFLVAPTGSGKTEIAMKLIQELNTTTLIIVHRSELLYQWQQRLEDAFNIKVGIIGDGNYSEKKITVAMIQTAVNKIPKNKYNTLIIDEAHHTPADTFYSLAGNINAFYRFGLSATPDREAGDEMKFTAMVGEIIQKITVRELIEMGYLAKPIFQIIDGYVSSEDEEEIIKRARGRGWQKELAFACLNKDVNNNIVNKTKELVSNGHLLYIDVRRIAHGNILKKMLKNEGLKVEFLKGSDKTEKRQKVLKEFTNNEGLILISTLIKEGVDLPSISAIIMAGPTASTAANLQVIGRALRPKTKNGNTAIIVDRSDQSTKLKSWYNRRTNMFLEYYGSEI